MQFRTPRAPKRRGPEKDPVTKRFAKRDEALALFDQSRPALLLALREQVYLRYLDLKTPVSVNDVRHLLDANAYFGDPRVLGGVFNRSQWLAVGYTTTNSERAHARSVRTFIPRDPEQRCAEHRLWEGGHGV